MKYRVKKVEKNGKTLYFPQFKRGFLYAWRDLDYGFEDKEEAFKRLERKKEIIIVFNK